MDLLIDIQGVPYTTQYGMVIYKKQYVMASGENMQATL
jgi:hypothetical protein